MPRLVPVASLRDLPINGSLPITVAGHGVLLVRLPDGVYAMRNLCSHQAQTLTGGRIVDGKIECPHHGAMFDVKSGGKPTMPAIRPIKTVPVHMDGDAISIDEEAVVAAFGAQLS